VTEAGIRAADTAERRELAGILAGLPVSAWDTPTLCAGWRVRELVAHMTMPFRYPGARFVAELIRSGGNFNRMADRCARRDARSMSPGELAASLADNASHPWKPPGGGYEGALTHDVIHGMDATVALGISRPVPAARLRLVLPVIASPRALKSLGAGLAGVELRADDMDWSYGSGDPVSGHAQDLALVMCGRKLPPGRLYGAQAARFCC
jgi:uncharacterized protein (TIGR03083 family)